MKNKNKGTNKNTSSKNHDIITSKTSKNSKNLNISGNNSSELDRNIIKDQNTIKDRNITKDQDITKDSNSEYGSKNKTKIKTQNSKSNKQTRKPRNQKNIGKYNSSLEKDQLKFYLGLTLIPGLGPISLKKALQFEPNPEKLWQASPRRLERIFGQHLAGKITKIRNEIDLDRKISELAEKNIKAIGFTDPEYPGLLLEIPDPPPILFYRGSLDPNKPAVAIVGSRKATGYGKKTTRMLAGQLASRGIVIVSGLALGIDRAAHEGALDVGGETWAVLGSGLDYQYPPENQDLYQCLPQNGALISEFPPEMEPQPGNFPRRNRIISGLCQGVVVVEAAQKSGSLITAGLALDQNRHVLAVPGNIDRLNSRGTNNLIKEGAMPVTSAEDIISYLYQLYKVDNNNQGNQRSRQRKFDNSSDKSSGNRIDDKISTDNTITAEDPDNKTDSEKSRLVKKQNGNSRSRNSRAGKIQSGNSLPGKSKLGKSKLGNCQPGNSKSGDSKSAPFPNKKVPDSPSVSTTGVIIPPDLTPAEKKILNIFTREVELTMNELQELTDIGAAGISVALINLEVAGVIGKDEGEKYYFKGLQNLLEPI